MSTHSSAATNRNIILYGYDPEKSSDISKSLQEQGVTLLRAAPCDVKVISVRLEVQPGYDIYVRNLPKFIEANRLQSVASFNPPFISLLSFCKDPLLKTLPALTVSFGKALGESETILADTGYSKSQFRNEYQYTFPRPTLELIKALGPFKPNRTCQCPNGTVNIDALNRYMQVSCLLEAILKVQNYPAFELSDILEVSNTPVKRQDTSNSSNTSDAMVDNEENSPRAKRFAETKSFARPSRTKQLAHMGTAQELPFQYGCIAKFIPDLAKMDKHTVPAFIDKYLFTGLGSDMDSAKDVSIGVRSAWGLVASTLQGDILAHICKTVEICLEVQAKPFVIYSGDVYVGTAILGTKFQLSIGNKTFKPLIDGDFTALLRDVDAHTAALRRILAICQMDGTVKSMRELRKVVTTAKLSSSEVDEIMNLAIKLSFTQPYWSFNYAHVLNCLSLLLDSTKEIEDDTPMHPTFLFTKDRIEEVLSSFGVNAPTFTFPSSTKFMIKEKPFSELKSLSMRWIPTVDAVADFKKMITDGYITQPKTVPNSANATIRTFSEKQKCDDLRKIMLDLIRAKNPGEVGSTQEVQPSAKDDNVDFF